jgi:TolB-like protein/DNA-binding SARP family transcriptional activator
MTHLLTADCETKSSWPDSGPDGPWRQDTTHANGATYPNPELAITVLGEIAVVRGGKRLPLPSSRKARALLAYLAITGRAHRRDRLCAMLWDTPDDPRGALRSSLSKLRLLVDEPGRRLVIATGDVVRFDTSGMEVDLLRVRRLLAGDPGGLSTEALEEAVQAFRGDFAEGLELPNCPDFEAWRVTERENARRMRVRALQALVERLALTPEAALPHARTLVQIESNVVSRHVDLLGLLVASNRRREAEEQFEVSTRMLGAYGDGGQHQLARSWRALLSRSEAGAPVDGEPEVPIAIAPEKSALPLPERPSLAVLPFTNMTDDRDQEYFADGVVEDIITALSRIKWFFVIARNSSFTYKGRAVNVGQVGRELGVRYVLEGSVRKADGRVRITAQLAEAASGNHIWADKFDGALADIFDLQDQITRNVVAAIEPSLRHAEIERARRKPTEALDAYDCFLRALPPFYSLTREGVEEALKLLERAIEIDPRFGLAKAQAARCYAWRNPQGWAADPDADRAKAVELARKAVEIAGDDPSVLWMAGFVLWLLRIDFDGAMDLYDRALALNPNSTEALTLRGWALATAGRPDEAIAALQQVVRLNPIDPQSFFTMSAMGSAYITAGRYDKALDYTRRALRERPTFGPALRLHAVCLVKLGQISEARETLARVLALEPHLTVSVLRERVPINDTRVMDLFLDGLRKAGLPE